MADDRQQTVDEFEESVGQGEGESKGHESGSRIASLLEKNKSDYTDDDLDHMKKVNSYVKRHLGQGPKNDPEDSKWRYSLSTFHTQRGGRLSLSVGPGRKPAVELALT